MAARQLVLPGEIVKKSNALARARWTVESVWEPRLVALLASKVRVDDTDFHVYEIPVSDVLRGSGGHDYKAIANVVDRIMSRVLTIYDDDGWTKYNVFTRCRFRKKDGILELGFHPDLRPHYLQLKKQFAQYNLMEFLMLPSIYSQRIYEILKSWNDKSDVVISIKELHDMLEVPESLRNDFAQFRRRVLEQAYKDISKTTLEYEWEPVKKGRTVIAIRFIFNKKAIALKEEEKQRKSRAKLVKRNNELFLLAFGCAKEKKKSGGCKSADNKPEVCDMCSKMRMLEQSDI